MFKLQCPVDPIPAVPSSLISLPAKTTRYPCSTVSYLPCTYLLEESQVSFSQIYPLFFPFFLYLACAGHNKDSGYIEVNPVGSLPSRGLVIKPQRVYDIRDTIFSGRREDMFAKEREITPS